MMLRFILGDSYVFFSFLLLWFLFLGAIAVSTYYRLEAQYSLKVTTAV